METLLFWNFTLFSLLPILPGPSNFLWVSCSYTVCVVTYPAEEPVLLMLVYTEHLRLQQRQWVSQIPATQKGLRN